MLREMAGLGFEKLVMKYQQKRATPTAIILYRAGRLNVCLAAGRKLIDGLVLLTRWLKGAFGLTRKRSCLRQV